jgi:hypothetical protein
MYEHVIESKARMLKGEAVRAHPARTRAARKG